MSDLPERADEFQPEWIVVPLFPQEETPEMREAYEAAMKCSYRAAMAEYGMPISAGLAFRDIEGFRGIAIRPTPSDEKPQSMLDERTTID